MSALLLACLGVSVAEAALFSGMAGYPRDNGVLKQAAPYPVHELLFRAQQSGRPIIGPSVRRRLPPAMRWRRPPPLEEKEKARLQSSLRKQTPKIKPSEALRLAQRRWPDSIALAVNLRGRMYVVKLKAGSRVIEVMVDAQTGRVVQ